ncbi:MAG: c-type cytochrome [Planctomycetia bacterium]|nr:c-type cytochrome [Planctomycetia bacterium]
MKRMLSRVALYSAGSFIAALSTFPTSFGRTLEERLLAEPASALADAARTDGDASRGAIVFYQPFMACSKCHVHGDAEASLGPDLTVRPAETTDAYLVDALLHPSRVIRKGFESVTIVTTSGQTMVGLVEEETPELIVLRDATQPERRISVKRKEVDEILKNTQSIMPAGQVNQLASRQQFLDLLRYLIEISEQGLSRAKELQPPPTAYAARPLPQYENEIDHAGMIQSLNDDSFQRGEAIYNRLCINCHGTHDKEGSLPTSLRFGSGKFKNGNDPYTMYQTLTRGFGMMVPQSWMVPQQKYDAIHYIREAYLKTHNAAEYFRPTGQYLASLPQGDSRGPEPSNVVPWEQMDYGHNLVATYEIGTDRSNFAYKGNAIRLDPGPGGVSQGRDWMIFDYDTLRMAGAWTGQGFIDWNGINFNGRHGIHPRVAGQTIVANPTGPGWANPSDGSFTDVRLRGRDDRAYGPLPRDWAHYKGMYYHGQNVIVSYTVGDTGVLEMPGLAMVDERPVFTRTFNIDSRATDLTLRVATEEEAEPTLTELVETCNAISFGPSGGVAKNETKAADTVKFDGLTRVEIAEASAFEMRDRDFTITARMKTTKGGTIFAKTSTATEWVPNGKTLFVRGGRLAFDIGWVGVVQSQTPVADGNWHDVAVTYSHETARVSLFVDGKASGSKVLRPKESVEDHVARIGYTSANFPGPQSYFDGAISEVLGQTEGLTWARGEKSDLLLKIPAGQAPLRFTLWTARSSDAEPPNSLASRVALRAPDADLSAYTRGGPRRWAAQLKTQAVIGNSDGPFAVDVITPPFDNPWFCRLRLTGFDFFPDGDRAAVSSWDGSVWLVSGLSRLPRADADGGLASELTWQRIASGLFQPLGVKIVDGLIYVSCRDQICILHDLNGDNEIDFYENFNNDHQVTDHFHEFAMGLQTDAGGNFYYAKSARHALTALVPHHGTLLRVSPDGSRTDVVAKGFRAANGVCVNPDGTFIVTDQEGHWNPKNRINWVREGGFYGNMFGYHDVTDASDEAMEQPLCWITNAFDRSPAELLWVDSAAWGTLKGSLLNLSYGYGKIYVVPHEQVNGQMQGGMCELPLPQFPTGIVRGRFNPEDQQLYACGMFAWGSNQEQQEGGFYRVRYTGKPVYLPIGLRATRDGVELTFSGPLDLVTTADAGNYAVKVWSLKRSADYGSKHYDEHEISMTEARPSADGNGVFLAIPDLAPTWCMEIKYSLKGKQGESIQGVIHNTVHRLGD